MTYVMYSLEQVEDGVVGREQPSVQVLRELAEAGHPVVGEPQSGAKGRALVAAAASGSGTTRADDGRGGQRGRSSPLLALVALRLRRVPNALSSGSEEAGGGALLIEARCDTRQTCFLRFLLFLLFWLRDAVFCLSFKTHVETPFCAMPVSV
jgi:hypothetical protein